ncbi:PVC-type heme-binding CxxCH protein [Tautonia sociabilis]|uniref:C-type cytochrome n=1 Tax=Tautonia sociabilis TaxID=2080755 RepID=A0A432MJR8_9BACT|nr:PVC-type heme-binding CxxCH protein [Tautonia sociabilis]RUL87366.1 c-type cytochrome [Tautonia sociabilis]
MSRPARILLALSLLPLGSIASAQRFPEPYDSQDPGNGLTPTSEAIDGLQLPDGFRATLFASEPDVRQPIALATDPRGRLWVAENYTYAEQAVNFDTDLRDRILILDDEDGDGRFDRRTVFWDEGIRLTSVEVGFGGVWALCAPYLLFIPDRDGDDRPDGPPVVLLDGWNADSIRHNLVNGLRWGPDGWLYGRHGIQANSRVGAPGTPDEDRVLLNCGVWRYHPTRKTFEVVARGTTNPWGMDWDEHGQLFLINTVIPHLWHVIPGASFERMYGEHFDPHLYVLLGQTADHVHWDTRESWTAASRSGVSDGTDRAGGGHAHSGLLIYQGDDWPEEYRGDIFALNFHGRRVNRDRPERAGATYTARHLPDPILWSDPWFRGIELVSGPDGGVFVADWSDVGECHENDGVHRSSGRIYKITHGDPSEPAASDLSSLDDAALVALLRHPNVWYARQARHLLQQRASAGADLSPILDLLRELSSGEGDEVLRLRALWTLHGIGGTTEDGLIALLDDPDEQIRTWAIRLLVDRGQPSEKAISAFGRLAEREQSGLVLTFLASALQRMPTDRRWPIARAIASHSEFADDPVLPIMLWYGIKDSVPTAPDRAAELASSGRFGALPRFIARRLTAEGSDPGMRLLSRFLIRREDLAFRRDVLSGMADALRGLRRADPPPAWDEVTDSLSSIDDEEIRGLVRELSIVFGHGRGLDELRRIATNPEETLSARRDAIATLVRSRADGLAELLSGLLSERDLASDAVRGLATVDDPATSALLLELLGRLPAEANREALVALASRATSARALLDAVEAGRIDRSTISAFLVRQLRTLGDEEIEQRVATIWPEYRPISESASARIAALRAELTPDRLGSADPTRGRLLFSQTCAQCHVLFGEGSKVGPELTGAQRGDLGYLLENLVDPNATLAADYRMRVFALADGRIVNGLAVEQTDRTVTIQTPSDRMIIPRDEIEDQRVSDVSLMPEGMLDRLSIDEVADLIRYLQSPGQVPLPDGAGESAP